MELDLTTLTLSSLKESLEVLEKCKKDIVVNLVIIKINEEIKRRENASKK